MEGKVQEAIQIQQEEAALQQQQQQADQTEPINDEEELNSDDDVPEYDEEIETGRNILLAYYKKVKFSDRRAQSC